LAVVTGPIDKYAARAADFAYPGQTEFFADLWQSQAIMILAGPKLRVGLVTNHLALRDVAGAISSDLICSKAILLTQSLRSTFGITCPRVAVTGLNPHAGDGGLFGDEEHRLIAPALKRAQLLLGSEATLTGPLPADTAFYRGYRGDFDAVLAMYHDQGLGPLKTVHFDDAVNISGGLRHFRASPDHGPAADLFLRRTASPASLAAAIKLAGDYLQKFGETEK
jgi:4-hydroxythreonine-4-phosphate dehydrogenase